MLRLGRDNTSVISVTTVWPVPLLLVPKALFASRRALMVSVAFWESVLAWLRSRLKAPMLRLVPTGLIVNTGSKRKRKCEFRLFAVQVHVDGTPDWEPNSRP